MDQEILNNYATDLQKWLKERGLCLEGPGTLPVVWLSPIDFKAGLNLRAIRVDKKFVKTI